MTIKQQIQQMRTFGGLSLIVQYVRMGLGGTILREVFSCIVHWKSLKMVFYSLNRVVAPMMVDKYRELIEERLLFYRGTNLPKEHSNVVWSCWLQGENRMPPIACACCNSQRKYISDREFRFINANNWSQLVSIPDDIVEKYRGGKMPAAIFSDMIRLELLIKYGGSWIDPTVLCTSGNFNPAVLDADIFMFQYGQDDGLSNWFITSCTNNPVLAVVRDVLHAYWREYNVVVYYFLFHIVFGYIMKHHPDLTSGMPYMDSYKATALGRSLGLPFKKELWDKNAEKIPFHKLTWKVSDKVIADKDNYYNYIIETYS